MKRQVILRGFWDGFIGSSILNCSISFLFVMSSVNTFPLLIGLLGAGISSVIYFFLMRRNSTNKEMIYSSLISVFCFVVFIVITLAVHISIPFNILALREGNNADAIILLLMIGSFIITSALMKLLILIMLGIKGDRGTKTGDGDLS